MLYTPLSYEDIHGLGDEYQQYELIMYQDKHCRVERMENGECRLLQLLSTDPNDFLKNEFMPGTIIPNQITYQ